MTKIVQYSIITLALHACPNNVKQPQCAPLLIKGFPPIPKGACMGATLRSPN